MVKKITAPATYNPGKGRPQEHLAYLNRGEMAALKRMNGNNQEVGPSNLPSFPPADAAGSSSKASSSKSTSSGTGARGPTGPSGQARSSPAGNAGGSPGASSRTSNAGGNQGGQKSSNNPSGGMMGGSGSGGSARTAPSSNAPASGGGGNAGSRDLGIAGVPGGASKQGGAQAPKAPAAGGGGGGGITGIANAGRNVTNLTAPSRTTPSVAAPTNTGGAFGPRANTPSYLSNAALGISPINNLGSYVKDQSRVPTRTDLGVAGVPGGLEQRFTEAAPNYVSGVAALTNRVASPIRGPGVTDLNAPAAVQPGSSFGGFNPASPTQQQAIDRGLIGSINLREQERANLTVGANSPLAAAENQFGTNPQYNPLSSPRAPAPNRPTEAYNPLSSVRTPASIAQQQDIAAIYGDPTLGTLPTPTGRAFNTATPVSSMESVNAINVGYDPLGSVRQYQAPNQVVAKNNIGMPTKDVSTVAATPASQYGGYGTFNVPSTPAAPQTAQAAGYDPLSSFNRYVAPTVAALENNTAPQTGPNESTMLKNGTLTREQVMASTALPENNFTIAEPPAISQAQWDAFNSYRMLDPGANVTVAEKTPLASPMVGQGVSYATPADAAQANANVVAAAPYRAPQVVAGAPAGVTNYGPFVDQYSFNDPAQLAQAVQAQSTIAAPTPYAAALAAAQQPMLDIYNRSPYQNVTPADPASRPYDITIPQDQVLAVENFPNVPPAPNAPGTPAVTDPLITLPDPAPPTDQYIGPTYPGFDIPGTGGNGGTNFAGPGQGGQGGQQIVPTAGPPPTTPTNPTPPGGGGNNPPPAPVNPFNPAFNNPAYNTVVQLPALTQIAPISQGMGSLLPNIVIIDPFTGQPVPR